MKAKKLFIVCGLSKGRPKRDGLELAWYYWLEAFVFIRLKRFLLFFLPDPIRSNLLSSSHLLSPASIETRTRKRQEPTSIDDDDDRKPSLSLLLSNSLNAQCQGVCLLGAQSLSPILLQKFFEKSLFSLTKTKRPLNFFKPQLQLRQRQFYLQ